MKKFIWAAIMVAVGFSLSAQVKATSTATAPSLGETQWEYLVVSFGKTYFGDAQKLLAYKSLGFSSGSESVGLENNLDLLAKFGWEFVDVLGTIGGDQQVVLKRRYDKDRAQKEKEAVQDEKKRQDSIEQEQANAAKAWLEKQKEAERLKKVLVDLDALEKAQADADKQALLKKLVTESVNGQFMGLGNNISIEVGSDRVSISFDIDVTEKVLKENTYRSSDVEQILSESEQTIKSFTFEEGFEVSVSIRATVLFQKKIEEVGSKYMLGSKIGDDFIWFGPAPK